MVDAVVETIEIATYIPDDGWKPPYGNKESENTYINNVDYLGKCDSSSANGKERESMEERTMGKCSVIQVEILGVATLCLIDTGSQV